MMLSSILAGLLAAVSLQLPQAEFARYHRAITGRECAPDLVRFVIDPKISSSGHDAYTIRSEGQGLKDRVRITGSNLRSVWYGLYDLLERRGGCRWFWDGDVVPRKDALDLSGLDVREEAHFEYRAIRYFAHRGLTRFQAEHWGPEEWRREIDWCLKRRLNVLMLRIGQDDLFQRAFPDVVGYPDASKPLAGHGRGYDNRSLFWPLEYRGRLRQRIQRYAFDRGLMMPEDFGTMTHWYSRTPEDFLEKMKPPFLPQATGAYGEKNGLVWDIRDRKWVDAYWKLTTTACDAYGEGRDQRLLHTIGLGERRCFKDRKDNLELKLYALRQFLERAHRDYPKAKVLLAGWDFYYTWHPEEVRALVETLDPARDIVWDYEGDATRDYTPEMGDVGGNNFTKWGVMGKFPYTYSVFLAFESSLDVRANYPLIEARQKLVQNDPKCAGYVFWPESSHTDTLLLEYFTANAWSREAVGHEAVLGRFCANRYGPQAAAMERVWKKVIPLSHLLDWGHNASATLCAQSLRRFQHGGFSDGTCLEKWRKALGDVRSVYAALAEIPWEGGAVRRDAIDLARTALDRQLILEAWELDDAFGRWRKGTDDGKAIPGRAAALAAHADLFADLLEMHTDYSLWESYQRLDAVEKVRNPEFPSVLLENAANSYCRSHQYELVRHLCAPRAHRAADLAVELWKKGDRAAELTLPAVQPEIDALMDRPLSDLRPMAPRTPARFAAILRRLASLPELNRFSGSKSVEWR